MKLNDDIEFSKEWLALEKCYFRILTMVTVLADQNRAYRGTLKNFCSELGIQNSSLNRENIKVSLNALAEKGYLKFEIDKSIFVIYLTAAAEKNKDIKKIKRAWYELIRNSNSEASWENVLKVFLAIFEIPSDEIITYEKIGNSAGISSTTVSRCIKTICSIKFDSKMLMRETKKEKLVDGKYITLGQTYSWGYNWE